MARAIDAYPHLSVVHRRMPKAGDAWGVCPFPAASLQPTIAGAAVKRRRLYRAWWRLVMTYVDVAGAVKTPRVRYPHERSGTPW